MRVGKTLLAAPLLALALCLIIPLTPVYAGTPTFTLREAYTTEAAYYIGQAVNIYIELQWKYLSQNYTLNIELWNETDKVLDLETGKVIPGPGTAANGTYTHTYTGLSSLTEEAGTKSYWVKVIDTGSGLLVASKKLSITVAEESLSLSVAWDDANDDRRVDVNEQVTFTVFVTWAFVNESASYSLYVDDGSGEQLVDTVTVTAGSGSASKTWSIAWSSAGTRTVKFTLKNAKSEAVAEASITINVGVAETPVEKASVIDLVKQNIYLILIVVACIGVAIIVAKYR